MELNRAATELGFRDQHELFALVARVPLADLEAIARFKRWQNEDGTKAGLLAAYPSLSNCSCEHAKTGLPQGSRHECDPNCEKCQRDYEDFLSGPGDW